jgi:hypothetical protein
MKLPQSIRCPFVSDQEYNHKFGDAEYSFGAAPVVIPAMVALCAVGLKAAFVGNGAIRKFG